jgi:type IV secretory pathway VirB10-like protein
MSPEAQEVDEVPVEDLTPEQASRIIHSHRKVRYGTACWPCRQRKVKCDNKQPCENCIKREHPQLCSYKPNRSNASKSGSASASEAQAQAQAQGKKRPLSPDGSSATQNQDRDHSDGQQPDGWPSALGQTPRHCSCHWALLLT